MPNNITPFGNGGPMRQKERPTGFLGAGQGMQPQMNEWRGQMQDWRQSRPDRPEDFGPGWGRSQQMMDWRSARPQRPNMGHQWGMGGQFPMRVGPEWRSQMQDWMGSRPTTFGNGEMKTWMQSRPQFPWNR